MTHLIIALVLVVFINLLYFLVVTFSYEDKRARVTFYIALIILVLATIANVIWSFK